ncbi:hypothetical protein Lfu02_11000 [Longispora fulva]|uniref:DUF1707 domain-containing protein n=1 Tax=Longispora fulva TaxID=619741 RepID=A0A8J7GEH2_9ACTN|nr:DUF1707 domain-containing protein [Longispora fulva]MBG6135037.1 hypothetical protein [Longispora fulva]GIG56728.1 hypothetical protein Lfu02_11000 [Longispora fulva]
MEHEPGQVRASDKEREQTVAFLRAALAEGMLTLEECDERQAAAYAAKYRHELDVLLTDLPRQLRWHTPEARAELRAWGRRRAFVGLTALAVVVTFAALSGGHFFWPILPIMFVAFLVLRRKAFRRMAGRGGGCGPHHRTFGPASA